eukprot:2265177-Rhodomonas_salina.1
MMRECWQRLWFVAVGNANELACVRSVQLLFDLVHVTYDSAEQLCQGLRAHSRPRILAPPTLDHCDGSSRRVKGDVDADLIPSHSLSLSAEAEHQILGQQPAEFGPVEAARRQARCSNVLQRVGPESMLIGVEGRQSDGSFETVDHECVGTPLLLRVRELAPGQPDVTSTLLHAWPCGPAKFLLHRIQLEPLSPPGFANSVLLHGFRLSPSGECEATSSLRMVGAVAAAPVLEPAFFVVLLEGIRDQEQESAQTWMTLHVQSAGGGPWRNLNTCFSVTRCAAVLNFGEFSLFAPETTVPAPPLASAKASAKSSAKPISDESRAWSSWVNASTASA